MTAILFGHDPKYEYECDIEIHKIRKSYKDRAADMAPKRDYTKEQMTKAVAEVQRGEKVSVAALKYNVPRITLRNKIMGINPLDCNFGPSTVLSEEEEKLLVKWILFMAEHHFPVTKDHLLDSVQKIIMEKQLNQCPFTNNRPGKKWYSSFLKRHPEVAERTAQNLTKAREEVTEDELNTWFKINKEYLESKDLLTALNNPTRIFNCDESAFFLQPKAGRVLVRKGEKNIYSAAGDEKENLTVLITANAAGTLAPPMIVYPYERIPKHVGDKIPGYFAIGKSDSGWMTAKTFFEYMANIFDPWLDKNKIQKPVLLFVDGHRSHMTLHLSEMCNAKGIEIIALYPNSTHLLQPMDVAVFRPLKSFWKNQVAAWKLENPGQRLNKVNFAPNFEVALQKISKEVVQNGFRKSGLYPFGPDYVDMGKLSTLNRTNSTQIIKENRQLTEKTTFIKILEEEIQEVYSSEKLKLFKQLFYLPRDEMEKLLPPEDESLFVIWAKNKSVVAGAATVSENTSVHPIQSELQQDDSVLNADSSPPKEFSLVKEGITRDPGNIPVKVVKLLHKDSASDAGPVSHEMPLMAQEHPENPGTPTMSPSTLSLSLHENLISDSSFTPSANNNTSVVQTYLNTESLYNAPNSLQVFSTAPTINQDFLNLHMNNTPQKASSSVLLPVGIEVPSPFKRALLWPEPDNKKRRIKEQLPSAITGDAWRAIMTKKEAEKKQKEEEKERRKKEREERKKQREKLAEQKKNTKKNKTKQKKKKQVITSSTDDSNTDIEYGDSEYDVQDDLENEDEDYKLKQRQLTETKENIKKSIRQRNVSFESEFEENNLPLKQVSKKKPKKDSYVIINYEGEYFPGIIKNIDGKQYEISTMILSKGNSFRWPENADQIWYNQEAIVENIENPVLINKRGFYKIKEMEKYLPFVSL